MELGWSCREKNKQSIDDPQHLSSARPGDTEGTKEDKRRNGGTTSTVSKQKKNTGNVSHKTGTSGGQWGKSTNKRTNYAPLRRVTFLLSC